MTLRIEDKKAIVAEVAKQVSSALSAAVADYRGLTSNEINLLRRQAHKSGVYLKVVRNSLLSLAIKKTSFECLDGVLKGPLILALSKDDPGKIARLFKNFQRDYVTFETKIIAISGKIFSPEKLDDFAKLPNREESLGMLASIMQAPAARFVRTLDEIPLQVVRTFAAIRESK